jgi:DEAD/DEAH box helicase
MGWEGLHLNPALVTALEAIGFVSPTEVQARALAYAVHPVDLIVSSKTGSGKTLTYLVPILNNLANAMSKNALASVQMSLILLPTRELALQVLSVLKAITKQLETTFKGQRITSCILAGGFSLDKQKRLLSYGPHLVIATVGRFWDILSTGKSEDLKKVASCSFLVLDEVDRIIDLGQMKELQQVLKYIEDPKSVSLGVNELTEAQDSAIPFEEAIKLINGHKVEEFDPEFDRVFLGKVRREKKVSSKSRYQQKPESLRPDQQETPAHKFGQDEEDDSQEHLGDDGDEEEFEGEEELVDGDDEGIEEDGAEEFGEQIDEEGASGMEEFEEDGFDGMDEEGFEGMDEEELNFDDENDDQPKKHKNVDQYGRKNRGRSGQDDKEKNSIIKGIQPPVKYKTNQMRRTFVVSATLGKTFFTSRMMTKKVKSNLKKLMKENPETVPNMKLKEIMRYIAFKHKTKVIDLTTEILLPETLEILKVDCPTEDKMLYLSYFARTYKTKTMIVFTNSISSASRVKSLLALAGSIDVTLRHKLWLLALQDVAEYQSEETRSVQTRQNQSTGLH